MLQAAREAGVKRVVFTSSAAAVGFQPDRLSDENEPFNLPPKRFPYGYSKVLAEEVVRKAVEAGQEVVTVNPVVILGPSDLNLISGEFVLLIKRLQWTVPVPPGGMAVIDVRDVVRMQIAAARQGQVGERYLLGAANFKYAHWFALIADVIGAARPGLPLPHWLLPPLADLFDAARASGISIPVDGNQMRLAGEDIFFDFSKGWNALGKPQITMRQSIADTYGWYEANGYLEHDATARLIERIGRWL